MESNLSVRYVLRTDAKLWTKIESPHSKQKVKEVKVVPDIIPAWRLYIQIQQAMFVIGQMRGDNNDSLTVRDLGFARLEMCAQMIPRCNRALVQRVVVRGGKVLGRC